MILSLETLPSSSMSSMSSSTCASCRALDDFAGGAALYQQCNSNARVRHQAIRREIHMLVRPLEWKPQH